jgi:hypothetical protein
MEPLQSGTRLDTTGLWEQLASLQSKVDDYKARIAALNHSIKETRQEMCEQVKAFGAEVREDSRLRDRAIREIYWEHPEILTAWIAEAVGLSVYDVVLIAGPRPSRIPCSDCGQPILVYSREELRHEADGPRPLCDVCWARCHHSSKSHIIPRKRRQA